MTTVQALETKDNDSQIKRKICSLFNMLHRKNEKMVNILLNDIISDLVLIIKNQDCQKYYLMTMVVKIMYYCRDHVLGKGERDLFYSMIYTFYKRFPEYAIQIIKQLPLTKINREQNGKSFGSVGCWRDIPNICNYVRNNSEKRCDDPLIDVLVSYMNSVLNDDLILWKKLNETEGNSNTKFPKYTFSLVAKWIPRERPATEWLFSKFVTNWYITNDPKKLALYKSDKSYLPSLLKCKMKYRKLVSFLNNYLDTIEVRQCANKWGNIEPENVNHCTMQKQYNMFFPKNILTSNNQLRIVDDICLTNMEISKEREIFDKKFYNYFQNFITSKTTKYEKKEFMECPMRDKDVKYTCSFNDTSIHVLTLRAVKFGNERRYLNKIGENTEDKEDIFFNNTIGYIQKKKTLDMKIQCLNKEWEHFIEDIDAENCIPIVCVNYETQYDYLGLACLYAKKSRRVMLLHPSCEDKGRQPKEQFIMRSFIDLSNVHTFVDTIEKLYIESKSIDHGKIWKDSGNFEFEIQALFSVIEYFLESNRLIYKNNSPPGKLIFISNMNIFQTLYDTYNKILCRKNPHDELFTTIVFHYMGTSNEMYMSESGDVNNITGSIMNYNVDYNKENEIIIISGATKAIAKHISNYSFPNNFDMLSHIINIYT